LHQGPCSAYLTREKDQKHRKTKSLEKRTKTMKMIQKPILNKRRGAAITQNQKEKVRERRGRKKAPPGAKLVKRGESRKEVKP